MDKPQQQEIMRARGAVEGAFGQLFRLKAQWDSTNSSSQALVARLINTLTELTHVGGDEWQQLSDGLDSAVETRLLQRVQETHAQLRAAHEVLARHCAAMAETSASVQRLHYGLARSLGVAAASHQPLFATSPVGYLALLAEEVAGMFQHELALKAAVVDDLPLCSNGDTARIYAASWSLQPYIDIARLDEIRRSIKAEVDACAAA